MGRLYFRQLLSGRDFAEGNPIARHMVNFSYLLGDRESGEALVVDPAYAPDELVGQLTADGLRLAGIVLTHYHADHSGGRLLGYEIAGTASLLEEASVPVHAQGPEVPFLVREAGIPESDIVAHSPGDEVSVGAVSVRLIHTPGHSAGSQCALVVGHLLTGDTLFLRGCGRMDLPGSDPGAMYESLQQLRALPADTVVYPGHLYSPEGSATLDEVVRDNPVCRPLSREGWLRAFAGV